MNCDFEIFQLCSRNIEAKFFRKNNKDRGYPERSKTTAYRSAADTPEAKLRSRLESYKRILERRVRTGDYETSEALPGKFSKGQYLPIPLPGFETETPAYFKDVPLEAQEDVLKHCDGPQLGPKYFGKILAFMTRLYFVFAALSKLV